MKTVVFIVQNLIFEVSKLRNHCKTQQFQNKKTIFTTFTTFTTFPEIFQKGDRKETGGDTKAPGRSHEGARKETGRRQEGDTKEPGRSQEGDRIQKEPDRSQKGAKQETCQYEYVMNASHTPHTTHRTHPHRTHIHTTCNEHM